MDSRLRGNKSYLTGLRQRELDSGGWVRTGAYGESPPSQPSPVKGGREQEGKGRRWIPAYAGMTGRYEGEGVRGEGRLREAPVLLYMGSSRLAD